MTSTIKGPAMTRRALLPLVLLLSSTCAIAAPVPQDKAAYVGEWKGPGYVLSIQQDGKVHYARKKEGSNINLDIELQSFNGDNFEAGIPLVHTTFVVSQPPHLDKGHWKMTVDGVELTKAQ
jgi:hypothetical protein